MKPTRQSGKGRHVKKSKKRNWRNFVDISEIDEFLEEKRVEERTGGAVSSRKNDELFVIDQKSETVNKLVEPVSRSRKYLRPLKCHAMLDPYPLIKPLDVGRNKTRKRVKIIKTPKLTAVENSVATDASDPDYFYDVWQNVPNDEAVDDHFLRTTNKMPVLIPKHLRGKPNDVPAVEYPHPGASYNPSYGDHQQLVRDAVDVEVKKKRDEERVRRAMDDMFPTVATAPTTESWVKEMGGCLGIGEDDDADDGADAESSDILDISVFAKRNVSKTEKQRRKEKERLAESKIREERKLEKQRQNEIYRLRGIKRRIRERDTELKQRVVKKAIKIERQKNQPKRLGRLKYQPPDIAVKLSTEIVGNLRHLTAEGSLLEDRFRSLQKRCIIEPRQRAKFKRKYKLKSFTKAAHKEFDANASKTLN